MKKYYRNRIMLSAMLSFLIILVIAVAGIWLFSYQRIERDTDSFIASRLEPREEGGGRRARFSQDAPPAMFGYTPGRRTTPMRSPLRRRARRKRSISAASRRTPAPSCRNT